MIYPVKLHSLGHRMPHIPTCSVSGDLLSASGLPGQGPAYAVVGDGFFILCAPGLEKALEAMVPEMAAELQSRSLTAPPSQPPQNPEGDSPKVRRQGSPIRVRPAKPLER